MALVKGDGSTLTKTPGGTVLQSVSEADPQIKVLINVYEDTPYDHVDYPTQKKQLKFYAGQIVRQSKWDEAFRAPTITAISPATGPAAGGTTITITGTGFSSDATVTVGGTNATSIVVKSAKKITAVTPAKTAGSYNVVVTTAGGSATKTGGFTTT